MTKLTVTTFLSVDGVAQGPGRPDEDTSGGFALGGWVFPYFDEQAGAFVGQVFQRSAAFLLGRVTYEIFAAYWPNITDENDIVATKLNGLPKYVASRTLTSADWDGTTIIKDDVPGAVRRLKQAGREAGGEGEIQVHGSPGLIQTLLAEDLVDEFNLLVFPVLLGSGKRLFDTGTAPGALALSESTTTGRGVTLSVYRRDGEVKQGQMGT